MSARLFTKLCRAADQGCELHHILKFEYLQKCLVVHAGRFYAHRSQLGAKRIDLSLKHL